MIRLVTLSLILVSFIYGQDAVPKLTNSQLAEITQANVYFQQNNMVAALPLYEHLAVDLPENPAYHERLAFCLMGKAENVSPGAEREALYKRAKSEAERAKALGDTSDLLQIVLDRVNHPPTVTASDTSEKMRAAEAAFGKGDMDGALALYQELAAEDPKAYEARLYAGDIYFRKHDAIKAGEWFQKAIDVDPNRETAYRYWADTLYEDGQKDAALQKYIDAVVAQPYDRTPIMGLSKWAKATGATLKAPSVQLPKAPEVSTTADGKSTTNITLDPNLMKDTKSGSAAWMIYPLNRALWRSEKFAKEYPAEKQYRHSLAEETESLKLVLTSLKEQKIPDDRVDASLHDLVQIGNDGLIEPFILLNLADRGIAQDYPAYRAQHREQIHAYILKYLVHQK